MFIYYYDIFWFKHIGILEYKQESQDNSFPRKAIYIDKIN